MKPFTTRAYNQITIDQARGRLIKTSKEKRLLDEIRYYETLKGYQDAKVHFPRIFSSGHNSSDDTYSIEMELYAYENLGNALLQDVRPFKAEEWEGIAGQLRNVLHQFSTEQGHQGINHEPRCREMYYNKTLREYRNLVEKFPFFTQLAEHPRLTINGKSYLNFETLWDSLAEKFPEVLYKDTKINLVHGDCCFSNILYGKAPSGIPVLKFVDPRGTFADLVAVGDPYYDIAKLMHSTEGTYEAFIYDLFSLQEQNAATGNIEFTCWFQSRQDKVHEIFERVLYSEYDYNKRTLIEGLIFIGMCARHYDSHNRQVVMYSRGIELLNKVYEKLF